MPELKVGSSAQLMYGPIMDSSDGITPTTELSLTTAPAFKFSKNGSTFANRDSTQAVTARAGGYYTVPVSSDDCGTEGRLRVVLGASYSTVIAAWEDYDVVAAQWWDSKYSTGDYLKVDTVQIEGADATTQIVQNVWNSTLESTMTMKQGMRLIASFAAGQSTGAGSTTLKFYGVAQSTILRIQAECGSSGNRKSITLKSSS